MEIEEICRRARAEGLTYGQYVWKHKVELAGKRPTPKVREGVRCCRRCGRAFVPASSRQVFCRTACRVAWNQKKRRAQKKKGE